MFQSRSYHLSSAASRAITTWGAAHARPLRIAQTVNPYPCACDHRMSRSVSPEDISRSHSRACLLFSFRPFYDFSARRIVFLSLFRLPASLAARRCQQMAERAVRRILSRCSKDGSTTRWTGSARVSALLVGDDWEYRSRSAAKPRWRSGTSSTA